MDLTKDYEKLYDHWIIESQEFDLSPLTIDMFNEYKQIVNEIVNYQEDSKDSLKKQLLKSYQDNCSFMFNDLLKMRKVKIINSALALREIDLEKVIEAEKLLFQNLISALKGYKKIIALSIYEEEEKLKTLKLIETKDTKKLEINQTEEAIPQRELIDTDMIEEEVNYLLIRFLKKTPPLVGLDLINYGPFEKEDIANIPSINAKILIFEKFAEEIDIS